MSKKHINFSGFSGYLNYLGYYQGYGGMNWNDMYEVQASFVSEHSWCDTGYNNVLSGQGEAITLGNGGFQSYNTGQTFDLLKGTFASAWETNQPVYFNSYTYTAGVGYTLKASDLITLGQDATNINFAHYGQDFKGISKVTFVSGVGQGGNTCSYGSPTYGYQLVMDNLLVKWHGAPVGQHRPAAHHQNAAHLSAPHLNAMFSPAHDSGDGGSHQTGDYHHATGHDPGGMTSTFTLPQAEHHFGF